MPGFSSIWFEAGSGRPASLRSCMCVELKLETPMERASPAFQTTTRPRHVETRHSRSSYVGLLTSQAGSVVGMVAGHWQGVRPLPGHAASTRSVCSPTTQPARGQYAFSMRPACGQHAVSMRPACGQHAVSTGMGCGRYLKPTAVHRHTSMAVSNAPGHRGNAPFATHLGTAGYTARS